MAEEKGSPQKKKTPDEAAAADGAAASAEAVVRQLAAMGIVAGHENGAGGGAKESQPAAGQGLTAGQVCGVWGIRHACLARRRLPSLPPCITHATFTNSWT